MVVERGPREMMDERGQSVLEFLLMLPMMIGLVVVLVRVNTAIQISINNQQYARAQALWLSFNSPYYPVLRLREQHLVAKGYNQMVIGVSSNKADDATGDFTPKAATQYIARRKGAPEGEAKSEPRERSLVRIRDTVTMCSPLVVIKGGSGPTPLLELQGVGSGGSIDYKAKGPYKLTEDSKFDYCSGPMQYVMGESAT